MTVGVPAPAEIRLADMASEMPRPITSCWLSWIAHDDADRFSRVLVTPPLSGWALSVGPWCGLPYLNRAADVTRICLSPTPSRTAPAPEGAGPSSKTDSVSLGGTGTKNRSG